MDELKVEVPQWKDEEAEAMAKLSGDEMYTKYSVVEGAKYCSQDNLK